MVVPEEYYIFYSETKEQSSLFAIAAMKYVLDALNAAEQFDEYELFADAGPHFRSSRFMGWVLCDMPVGRQTVTVPFFAAGYMGPLGCLSKVQSYV